MEKRHRAARPAYTLMLDGRARAKLTGVTAVSCFNDREVVLETGEGEVALLGENLHIEQLNLDDGQLDVTGEIVGVEYSEATAEKGAARAVRPQKGVTAPHSRREALGMDGSAGRGARGFATICSGGCGASRLTAGAADLLLGALCAVGMTVNRRCACG